MYTYKQLGEDGVPTKFKARLVAQGFKKFEGLDYTKTFAPMATFASLRIILVIGAKRNLPMHSFDVSAAYFHSELDKKLFLKLPPREMLQDRSKGKVLEVVKALYATKQGGRCWWKLFEGVLVDLGFTGILYDQ